WAGPKHGSIHTQILGHVLQIDHGAIHHVTRDPVLPADGLFTDHRLDAVAAHHRVSVVDIPLSVADLDPIRPELDISHRGRGLEFDQRVVLYRFQNGQMDIGAMNHAIRTAETLAEFLVGVDTHDLVA